MDTRQWGCLGLAIALVLAGTLSTGVLPSTAAGQTVAGGIVVAGFALLYYCLRE